jgi:hypothetical protein
MAFVLVCSDNVGIDRDVVGGQSVGNDSFASTRCRSRAAIGHRFSSLEGAPALRLQIYLPVRDFSRHEPLFRILGKIVANTLPSACLLSLRGTSESIHFDIDRFATSLNTPLLQRSILKGASRFLPQNEQSDEPRSRRGTLRGSQEPSHPCQFLYKICQFVHSVRSASGLRSRPL